jgi:hypothetical protein
MTKMKSISERGSPCLNPRRCVIVSPGWPFNRTLVVAAESRTVGVDPVAPPAGKAPGLQERLNRCLCFYIEENVEHDLLPAICSTTTARPLCRLPRTVGWRATHH